MGMNYIVISDNVYNKLKEQYEIQCNELDYIDFFDTYLHEMLSYNDVFCLFNRCQKQTTYSIVGKGCILFMELHSKYKNCFYGKRIKFLKNNSQYLSQLSQTIELPGEWSVININETHRIEKNSIIDISEILNTLKASDDEFYEFREKWMTWDLYNEKLSEAERKKEENSECKINKVVLDNNIVIIHLDNWNEVYKIDSCVSVQCSTDKKFVHLGKIIETNIYKQIIQIECDKYMLLNSYLEGRIGKLLNTRVVNFGTSTRLRRQKEALKKLFQDKTANKNLKDILMGEYDFQSLIETEDLHISSKGIFGVNIRQEEAYIGALNTQDIYLIQGPPGTGKTTIITEIVKNVINNNQKVLVSSETHIAVDNVLERIQYMQNIMPIRLGKEERISQSCIKFLPYKISKNILNNAKGRQIEYINDGWNIENLIHNIEDEWNQKIQHIEAEIDTLKINVCIDIDRITLHKKIIDFENLAYEIETLFLDVIKSQKEHILLNEKKIKLFTNKAEIESVIEAMTSKIFESDIIVKEDSIEQITSYKKEVNKLLNKLNTIEKKISSISYEVNRREYERRKRKLEREKDKMLSIIGTEDVFAVKLYNLKNILSDIKSLNDKKEKYIENKNSEIEKIKFQSEHRIKILEKTQDLRNEWIEALEMNHIKDQIESIYLSQANVVFATCSGIVSNDNKSFAEMEYDYVIIDETAKCNTLDLLIPLIMGKKIILVGDHKQLYPMLDIEQIKDEMSDEQIVMLKEHTLFKWLYEDRVPDYYRKMLNRQYRMTPDISKFVSDNFYGSKLKCEKERKSEEPTMLWIECTDSEEEQEGTGYKNENETKLIIELIKKIDRDSDTMIQVGVICTYRIQANILIKKLSNLSLSNIELECNTVDAFQGKEKHTIVFNIVRSKELNSFVKDVNRVNVAVSRAQEKLYVVGSCELVKRKDAGVLGSLYEYIKQYGEVKNSNFVRL